MSFYNLTLHERRRRSTDASVVAQEEQDQDLTPVVSRFVAYAVQVQQREFVDGIAGQGLCAGGRTEPSDHGQ
tara:strand:+ start:2844 stop:3059 length:216 start_codon:yes stop_codon:yes gene_type:complete